MEKTLKWQLYVSCYTLVLGVSLMFFPDQTLPRLGFAPTSEPWVRLVGMFGLVLCYISTMIYIQKIVAMLPHSIIVRAAIATVLIIFGLIGYPPAFFLLAGIVLMGVVGSAIAYFPERRAYRGQR